MCTFLPITPVLATASWLLHNQKETLLAGVVSRLGDYLAGKGH